MGRVLWRVLLVTSILAFAAGAGWYLYGGAWRERYEARVEALRAAGQPTRFEDLATPRIPDEENGAKLLEKAHRILEERMHAPGNAELLLGRDGRTAEEAATAVAYLDSLAPYFDLLSRVPQRPGWWLDLDWAKGLAMNVALYAQLSEAQLHLAARVELDPVEAGRTERAADTAALLLALGGKPPGPYVLGYLIAQSVSCDAVSILRSAMRRPGFDAAAFRRIVDPPLARSIPDRGPPRLAFVQERTLGIGAVEAIRAGAPYGIKGKERTISLFRLRPFYRDANRFLDAAERALSRCDTTPENAIAVAAELRAMHEPDDVLGWDAARRYSSTFLKFADGVTVCRLARVVMALLEYRQRERMWPEGLAALGELPNDPYGAGPFLYERTEHGCRVRSAKDGTPADLEERFLAWTLEDDQIPAMPR